MNKDYIKRFFMLTEQNILGSQVSANDDFDAPLVEPVQSYKRKLNATRVGLISICVGICVAIWSNFFYTPHTDTPRMNQSAKKTSPAHVKPVIQAHSKIPYYREGANQQTLQHISLRKPNVDIKLDDEAENIAAVAPVVDKVIVVPKSFG